MKMGTPLGKWGPLLSNFRECPVNDMTCHITTPSKETWVKCLRFRGSSLRKSYNGERAMCVTLYNYLPMVQARRSVTLICYSSSLPSTARFGLSLHDNPKRRSRKVDVRILGTW